MGLNLLLNVGFSSDVIGLNIYGGGGLVYQKSELNSSYTTYSNESYGYSYSAGVEVIIGNKFVVYSEFSEFSAASNFFLRGRYTDGSNYYEDKVKNLNVGSTGISFGVGYRL